MDEKAFVNEVRGFLFYSKVIWPLHRRLAGKYLSKRCTRCAISTNYSSLSTSGLCSACEVGSGKPISERLVQPGLVRDVEKIISESQGKGTGQFDALILFSGGKDSSYLVHRIRHDFPQLRVLLYTVDNTFMSPLAVKNVDALVKHFDLPHVIFRPPAKIYNKMFAYAFKNLNKKGCSGTVDQFDGDFFHDAARNYARQNGVPLILSGCSRTQVEHILNLSYFEFPKEFEGGRRTEVAGISLRQIFSEEEMKYWMNESGPLDAQPPRLIFPFYAWDLDESEILKKVTEWNLLQPSARNPLLTNNQLIPTMAIVDMVKFGYSSFEPEFCKMIRAGKADPIFWRNVFELSEYAAKTGRFVSKSVDQSLVRLGLTRRDMGIPE